MSSREDTGAAQALTCIIRKILNTLFPLEQFSMSGGLLTCECIREHRVSTGIKTVAITVRHCAAKLRVKEVILIPFSRDGRRKNWLLEIPAKMNLWIWWILISCTYSFHIFVSKWWAMLKRPCSNSHNESICWVQALGCGDVILKWVGAVRENSATEGNTGVMHGLYRPYARVGSRTVSIWAYRWACLRVVCSLLNTATHAD